ncbi:MAG: class I SAM-dependent methyltransferase [Cyanobacteria bacterium]|nr:class I SAM-dependent methyltransferase [Cyanobacteriota bacterium]MDW8200083.1 methyltransferase domain-containing protein [Cyanobacteriota bacterium SKYGB_h_bin112]
MKSFQEGYKLAPDMSVLDVGCGKGFMLYDLRQLMSELTIAGIDISQYAIKHSKGEVRLFYRLETLKPSLVEPDSPDLQAYG